MVENIGAGDAPRRRVLLETLTAGDVTLADNAAQYTINVLRLKAGDRLQLFDGAGAEAIAEILDIDRKGGRLRLRVDEPVRAEIHPIALCVGLAVPKGARADWAVEKLTELGAAQIVWIDCERSVSSPSAAGQRMQRWRRICAAAATQSGRADLPVLERSAFADFVATSDAPHQFIADTSGVSLVQHLGVHSVSSTGCVILLVGPEGGFSGSELETATKAGYTVVKLGAWTMRVETAAVAGAALVLGA